MRLHRISFLFILALGTANAFAQPIAQGRDARRDAIRAYQVQVVTMDRNPPHEQQVPVQTQQEPRRTGFGMSGSSGYNSSGDSQSSQSSQSNQANDNMRRQGRMSPEERRALRRQIDEAGHDIYSPRR